MYLNLENAEIDYPWKHVVNSIAFPYSPSPSIQKFYEKLNSIQYSERPIHRTPRGMSQKFQLHTSYDGQVKYQIDKDAYPYEELSDATEFYKVWRKYFKDLMNEQMYFLLNALPDESELTIKMTWVRDLVDQYEFLPSGGPNNLMRLMYFCDTQRRAVIRHLDVFSADQKQLEYELTQGFSISYCSSLPEQNLKVATLGTKDEYFIKNRYYWLVFDIERKEK